MNDEKKSPAISSLLNFSKYSVTTIHILVELICFLVIYLYIRRNVRKLQNQIDDLTSIIQQQQEIIHVHQKILNSQHIPQSAVGTGNDTSFEVFHIPINISDPQPPSQTIIEEQTPPPVENQSLPEEPQKPLTEEAIEQVLIQEMQELKQEEEKQDDDEDDSVSPSGSSNNKKKNRRRH